MLKISRGICLIFMKMTIKHNFDPFCNSRQNALQRFLMPCIIDPLKALLHWDVIVLMDRYVWMMWFSPAAVKRWPAFICTRGSSGITDIELYVHLHPCPTAQSMQYNQFRDRHVCFISSIAFGWLSQSCVFDLFTWRESAGVCLNAYTQHD